jgi:hypothetical protein
MGEREQGKELKVEEDVSNEWKTLNPLRLDKQVKRNWSDSSGNSVVRADDSQ